MKFSSLGLASIFAASTAFAATTTSSSSSSSSSSAVPEIVIKGNKFFYSNNGTQFFMRGVAYQQQLQNSTSGDSFTDPLADGDSCKRDLPYLQKLQTNVIRVYAINTSVNHDECLNLFAENGIYVVADLSEPGLSISRDSPSWTVELYNRYTEVVDEMAQYSNVLGFFAGNEVTNNNTNTDASPFVKAAIRDTKAYIKSKSYRSIPVGYSTNDDADTRDYLADFFACGDADEAADFYGINMYEWCGSKVDFESSGYADRTDEFANYTIPVFFSEYGCNVVQPRTFEDVPSLYSKNMTDVWSGGIVYMYFEEDNNYGLVTVKDSSVSTLRDFSYLSEKLASAVPTGVNSKSWTATNTVARECPASTLSNWKAASVLPPTPKDGICQCMVDSLSCVVASKVKEEDYETLFNYVCSQVSCDGITADGSSGSYGSYSFCSPAEKLSFVLDLYYKKVGSKDACSFSGSATLTGKSTTASTCSAIISQAGTAGAGSVTASVADATGASSAKATSGSSAAASGASSSAATNAAPAAYNIGMTAVAALAGSVLVGLGLVM
ncbi:hypothetical protein D0Z00_004171 [Geotrichum galactomycetum]|uniref:Uncharacterized protein n=1 Tax=Geotrichum galactomycetum TaxID=27317 RepID=A0ACB6UZ91_9ASCO|nr:hypothetical protein D0Z00_004171 [Geotrichum candidum]